MYVELIKLFEDNNFVEYEVHTTEYFQEMRIDIDGKEIYFKRVSAICRFNKETEAFEIDTKKSDSYLLKQNSKEMMYVYCRLLSTLRNGDEFPSEIVIATGG